MHSILEVSRDQKYTRKILNVALQTVFYQTKHEPNGVCAFFYSIIQRLKQTIIQQTWKKRKKHNWIAYGLPFEQNQIYSEILTIAMSIWALGNPFRKMHDKCVGKTCTHTHANWSISLYKLHIVCIDSSKAYTETSIYAIV